MRESLHAEWTKVRTVAGTGWLVLGMIVLTVAVGALVSTSVSPASSGAAQDTTKLALSGVDLGQAIAAVLGVLIIADEYRNGMIRITLAAVPRRLTMLGAKACVVTALVMPAGVIAVAGSLLAGRPLLAGHGYPLASLAAGSSMRAAGGTVLYLGLIALLGLGVATALRDPGAAIGFVLGLLYLPIILGHVIGDPHLQRHIQQLSPMTAGQSVQATVDVHRLPISPWAGLGVLAAWTAAALVTGGLLLRARDA